MTGAGAFVDARGASLPETIRRSTAYLERHGVESARATVPELAPAKMPEPGPAGTEAYPASKASAATSRSPSQSSILSLCTVTKPGRSNTRGW